MKDSARRDAAQLKAEAYAPRPKDSRLIYVIVAVSMLLVSLAAVGGFYAIDVWGNLPVVMLLAALASAAALLLRRTRLNRHNEAHRLEYEDSERNGQVSQTFKPASALMPRGTGKPSVGDAQTGGPVVTTNGIVKFFNVSKGFGYIAPEGGGQDAYVHARTLDSAGIPALREGQKVSYDLQSGDDGKQSAINVRVL